ncbi:protein dopey-1-like isoform X1 [Haliotis asinina]|uniref:protein dopey-1-like isoform X1 n=1 Tax=Haliotis asinina TaxID=109174 RepID=UPI0035324573
MSMLTIEECELLSDSKYRNYISQVEKALRSFENTSEWADLISALAKLNKVLLAHMKYPVVPKKVTIGKRLAQCLHPALPSGVHLKALETYDIIFKCIGTQRLAVDLFIYSAGMFPLLSHAAMSVKPVLLTVYEKHFVPLGKHIKPGLNGLLLGLLPGLEEGAENYDRTNVLLEDFRDAAVPSFFYTCLWECVLSCPSVRLPAITFLVSHYNKKQTMEDQLDMMGLEIDLMVKAICGSLQDTSVLVQRILLDFLLLAFPMHNAQLTKEDMSKIVKSAINVVLRRDMSLNRRLYGWLLGTTTTGTSVTVAETNRLHRSDSTSTSSEMDLGYFHQYSKDLLVKALKGKLNNTNGFDYHTGTRTSVLKPFRILISLLDKPEIGPVILESVLLSVFRCLLRECKGVTEAGAQGDTSRPRKNGKSSKESTDKDDQLSSEMIKTANLLFGSFEPYFIWDFVSRLFTSACDTTRTAQRASVSSSHEANDTPSLLELCSIVEFLLDIVSLEMYLETQTEYLPELLHHIIASVTGHVNHITEAEVTATLKLCTKILEKVQPSMTTGMETAEGDDDVMVGSEVTREEIDLAVKKRLEEKERNENSKNVSKVSGEKEGMKNVKNDDESVKEEKVNKLEDEKDDESYFSALSDVDGANSPLKTPVDQTCSKTKSDAETDGTLNKSDSKQDGNETKSQGQSKPMMPELRRQGSVANPVTLMQACVHSFQDFFHVYTSMRVLKSSAVSSKCIDIITLSPELVRSSDKDSVLDGNSTCSGDDRPYTDVSGLKVSAEGLMEKSFEAFGQACRLLVDFSSFPMFCTDYQKVMDQTCHTEDSSTLPEWLQDLITCACFVDCFEIQSAAIATILELITLTQSVQSVTENKGQETRQRMSTSERGTVSVVILPSLLPRHLQYINDNMVFYQTVARELWSFLSSKFSMHHLQCVELFHQLHQVTPNSWVCEDVIGTALVSDNEIERIEALKKFTVLWHLTRDLKIDHNPGHPVRTFDRSMFVVLDYLKEESNATKTLAATWLTHVVQRGDINRVLQPLLLMLLHPDTARISIQHVNVHKPKKVQLSESGDEDDINAKVYAISSEGGNVIFHVSQEGNRFSQKTTEDLKSVALTVMSEKGSATTARSKNVEVDNAFDRVNPDDLNLRINPFGSQNSLDKLIFDGFEMPHSASMPNLTSARRLDKETCKKEGIFFDAAEDLTAESTDDEAFVEEVTNEDFVREMLEEIILKAVSTAQSDGFLKREAERTISLTSKDGSILGDHDLLNAIGKRGLEIDSLSSSENDLRPVQEDEDERSTDIHTLHMHILLYTQKYDYKRALYALSTIKAMLTMCPRLVVTAMSTTSISAIRAPHMAKIQTLLARHRKSVFGKNFFGELPPEVLSGYRSNMFIEIVISLCLYYVRSYYPNLMISKPSSEELLGNKEVHIMATEILTLLMSELVSIMRDSGKSFRSYIGDLLTKCKLQKALLHCLLASVYNNRKKNPENKTKITEAIIAFNEEALDPCANETFQIKLLNLILVMIMLEEQIYGTYSDPEATNQNAVSDWDRTRVNFQTSLLKVHYLASSPIVQQTMFLSGVLSTLKQHHMCHMHRHWVAMVTSALPYMGKALSRVVLCIVSQLCRNLEVIAGEYVVNSKKSSTLLQLAPPDHTVTMLEGLTTLCHYCLLDNVSPMSIGQPAPTASLISTETASAGHILTNLIHVFNPINSSRETSPQRDDSPSNPVLEARRSLLSILPRIMACMSTLWRAINTVKVPEAKLLTKEGFLALGSPKVIRQQVLEFLSPISVPHGTNLLGAFAVAWNDRRKKTTGIAKRVIPQPCEDQLLLVELVAAIKVLPTDTLIQTVKQVLKQPPPAELGQGKKVVPLEVNMLQFFYAYIQQTGPTQLLDSWPSLLGLFREGLQLNLVPPGQFLLLEILNEFVQKTPTMEEKKNQKDLQEITQKVLEAVGTIAGSSLEQTTWLRRNLAVKPGPQADITETEDGDVTEESDVETIVAERKVMESQLNQDRDAKYSVQALSILAELTAALLDVVYGSDEKDKVAPFLMTTLTNVFPYLRNHSCHNLPSFRACSQILANISGYQYTRKAWRKEALELLLDLSFFQMDVKCIGFWRTVIDNLMTHDKTTFKDLMGRVAMTQSGSLNLFSSKEQEYEQRAQMLKRLSFAIFCSDADQYQRNMPDIQERLAESLRLTQVPTVMTQVFLCFRVLILRMSHQHLTSLWPTIITEMVHVFLQIEQELSTDSDEFKGVETLFITNTNQKPTSSWRTQLQRIAALDSSWAHLGNGLNAHNNPAWLQLYLSVCKLLDLCLALPADIVPQFQLYRWAFIGAAGGEEKEVIKDKRVQRPCFVPHVVRLSKLLNTRLSGNNPILRQVPGRPLLTFTVLRSLVELQPFFNTLCNINQSEADHSRSSQSRSRTLPKSKSAPVSVLEDSTGLPIPELPSTVHPKSNKQFIEELVERDFLEFLSQ